MSKSCHKVNPRTICTGNVHNTCLDLEGGFRLIKFTIKITEHRPQNAPPRQTKLSISGPPLSWYIKLFLEPLEKNFWIRTCTNCIEMPLTTSQERMNCKYQQNIVFVCKVFFHAVSVFLSGGNKYDSSPIHHQGRDGDDFTHDTFFLLLGQLL